MNNAWSVEYWRLVLVIVSVLLIGVLTGYWYIAWLLPVSIYIAWQLRQLYSLNQWLDSGAKTKKAPETNGAWALIVQQIYRHRRAEIKQKKKLARTLKRFSTTASALPDATIVLDKIHQIEWLNQATGDLLGIDRKRDTGLRIETLIRNPEFYQWMNSPMTDDYLEIASPADASKTVMFRKVKFGKGQILLTARDISQRVQLLAMRKTFVANASHELRTPLTVISGYLDILRDTENLPDDLRKPVTNAITQAQRMQQIIEDLLYLSRLETTELSEKNTEPVNMALLIKQQSSELQKTLATNTHNLQLDTDDNLILRAVEADFLSVVTNLIKNAILHTPAGTTVQISWKQDKSGRACLDVTDNGPGIPIEHLPSLTERFYRVDPGRSRETGTTGLGLSIVKHVMQQYGGTLEITSTVGKGSSFKACFPASRVLHSK